MKDRVRSGWLARGVPHPESVADHSWGTALLTALFADTESLNKGRAVELAVVHDIAEAKTGDIPTRLRPEDRQISADQKRAGEYRAMAEITSHLGPEYQQSTEWLMDLFEDYEQRRSPEARFVSDMNLIDMVLQALIYRRSGRYDRLSENIDPDSGSPGLTEFFETAEPRLQTVTGRRLFADIRDRFSRIDGV